MVLEIASMYVAADDIDIGSFVCSKQNICKSLRAVSMPRMLAFIHSFLSNKVVALLARAGGADAFRDASNSTSVGFERGAKYMRVSNGTSRAAGARHEYSRKYSYTYFILMRMLSYIHMHISSCGT